MPERLKAAVPAEEEIRGLRGRAREISLDAVGGGQVTFRGALVSQWRIRWGEPEIEVASRYWERMMSIKGPRRLRSLLL